MCQEAAEIIGILAGNDMIGSKLALSRSQGTDGTVALPAAPLDFALAPANTHVPEQDLAICRSGGKEVALPHCPALICGLQAVGWGPSQCVMWQQPPGTCRTSSAVPRTQQASLQPLLLLQAAAARQPAAHAALTMPSCSHGQACTGSPRLL